MSTKVKLLLLAVLAVATAGVPSAQSSATTGVTPTFKHINKLAFGPEGVLFVADAQEVSITALQLAKQMAGGAAGTQDVPAVDQKIAGLLGVDVKNLLITDMVVNPRTRHTFISVMRGTGAGATPVILRVDGAGKIEVVSMDQVRYSKIGLPNPPPVDTPLVLAGGRKLPVANYPDKVDPKGLMGVQTITHMAFIDGKLYVSGLSSEEFASKMRVIPLMGISEGVPMSILFAATYPERTQALVLYGGMARATEAPGYPWGPSAEAFAEATEELIMPVVYSGGDIDAWAPSLNEDPAQREWLGRYRRAAMSPDGIEAVIKMFLDIDVRHVLSTLHVPTLVLHRHGDRVVNWRASQWMAEQIPGARRVELPGQDHFPWAGDTDAIVEEVRAFLTGTRVAEDPDRVLATVMFTDVVGSTSRAASLGDRRWTELLDAHDDAVRRELTAFRGREIKTTGDGFLATFDGPARGIRCARAIRSAATDLHIDVRVGLHTGEIELRTDDISGLAVHISQRVSAAAQPAEIVVSSTVKDLVAGSGIEFEDRGVRDLKGVPGSWRLYAVTN